MDSVLLVATEVRQIQLGTMHVTQTLHVVRDQMMRVLISGWVTMLDNSQQTLLSVTAIVLVLNLLLLHLSVVRFNIS